MNPFFALEPNLSMTVLFFGSYKIDPTSWISSHPLVATAPISEDDEQDPLESEDRDVDYLVLSKILSSSTRGLDSS